MAASASVCDEQNVSEDAENAVLFGRLDSAERQLVFAKKAFEIAKRKLNESLQMLSLIQNHYLRLEELKIEGMHPVQRQPPENDASGSSNDVNEEVSAARKHVVDAIAEFHDGLELQIKSAEAEVQKATAVVDEANNEFSAAKEQLAEATRNVELLLETV